MRPSHLLFLTGLMYFTFHPMAFASENEMVVVTSADTAFHAAMSALAHLGAHILKSDAVAGTIFAQSVNTEPLFTKVTNWNVTVENRGEGKILVRVDRATMNRLKSSSSLDEDAGMNQKFFEALDSAVAKRISH